MPVLVLEIFEQMPQKLDVGLAVTFSSRLARPRTISRAGWPPPAPRPDGKPLFDQRLRQRVERGLGLVLEPADFRRPRRWCGREYAH